MGKNLLKNTLLSLSHGFLLLGRSSAANPKQLERAAAMSACSDASISSVITCLSTAMHAVQLVTDADGSINQACASINNLAIARQDLDRDYLNKLICTADVSSAHAFYKNGYDTMAQLAFVRMALFAAEIDAVDPSLTIFCPLLDLIVLLAFGLPAEIIFNAICQELFMPVPTSTPIPMNTTITPSAGPSMTNPMSSGLNTSTSSVSETGSSNFFPTGMSATGSSNNIPTGMSATGSGMLSSSNGTMTTSPTSSLPGGYYPVYSSPTIHKRQLSPKDIVTPFIIQLKSLIFALDLIISRRHLNYRLDCDPDRWVSTYDNLGYDGVYTEAWICAAATGADLFPTYGLQAARVDFIIALQGLIFALNDPDSPARRIYCDFLDIGPLMTAELAYNEILFLVCFPFGTTLGTGVPLASGGSPMPTLQPTVQPTVQSTGTGGLVPPTLAPMPTSEVYKVLKREAEASSYSVYD